MYKIVGAASFSLLATAVPAWAQMQLSSIAALQRLGAANAIAKSVTISSYYDRGRGGGGQFTWHPDSNLRPDGCLIFAANGVAVGRWVREGGNKEISVQDCGARGDGASDDTGAQRAAILTAARGGTVTWPETEKCYLTTDTLHVTKPLTLSGKGTICWKSARKPGFKATVGGLVFEGLTLKGPQYRDYSINENAIEIRGVFRSNSPPEDIEGVTVRNCIIQDWGDFGILVAYAKRASLSGNRIQNIVYAGIGLISVRGGGVSHNNVRNITGRGTPEKNAYGIFASRASDDIGNLISQPRSTDIVISNNQVRDVPTWEAYDTHGGQNIIFSDNTSLNTRIGIAVGGSKNSSGDYAYSPLGVTVLNNRVDSGVTDGSAVYGISFSGTDAEAATGRVAGNQVKGFGNAHVAAGAINLDRTRDLAVTSNSVLDPASVGIFLGGENTNLSVLSNEIVGPWTDDPSVGEAVGLRAVGNRNIAHLARNRILGGGRRARFLITGKSGLGIRLSAGNGNRITLQDNVSEAESFLYDQANAVQNIAPPGR